MSRITETRNPASKDLDQRSTQQILDLINVEDQLVAPAVREIIPSLARAVDETVARMKMGGRVFYLGAGTSGRLGILDASEIPPTFGVSPELFQGIIAGGYEACYSATEASEDDAAQGARDLETRGCSAGDIVVGIAASGTTAYTQGALEWAKTKGALTVSLCCNPDSPLPALADHAITVVVGPEIIAGSTRMKAGTAQKLVLNMFSTATMVKLGHVYSHWMINVQMKNQKLKARGLRILMEITGAPEPDCRTALEEAGTDLKLALVMLLGRMAAEPARHALGASGGNLRRTLQELGLNKDRND
jgi:N-acetylmuramic acid 6-phosphate etherase